MEVFLCDTATRVPADARGQLVVCGSHGGRYAAWLLAQAGAGAVVLSDAGVGKDEAGVAGLADLAELGMPAVAVDVWSARIGDARDLLERGRISRANAAAERLGVAPGMTVAEAVERLRAAESRPPASLPAKPSEGRKVLDGAARRLVLADSAALVEPADAGQVVVTGSHGGVVACQPEAALKVEGFAAAFNDAGIGIEDAGVGRLPLLQARGIAALTVAAASARIGEARSTYDDGVVSRVNARAAALGVSEGEPARAALDRLAAL